jgi:acyl-homoserine lactone acylase PvdQ
MKYLKLIISFLIVFIVIIALALKTYFQQYTVQYSGQHKLLGIKDTVDVYTDLYGVPHVFSKNNEDLYFVTGYLTARERLFQLSIIAAVTNGNISSLLGDSYAPMDKYIKAHPEFLNIKDSINISDSNLVLIEAYCKGINTFIEECKELYPVSFKIASSEPIKWTPIDVINALELSTRVNNANSESTILYAIDQYFDDERLFELSDSIDSKIYSEVDLNIKNLKLQYEILDIVGAAGSKNGSYAKIITPNNDKLNNPILIFDDIWGYKQPNKWFNIYLNGGDFNIEGSSIVGFPIPIIGRTDHSVFAVTGDISGEIDGLAEIARGLKDVEELDIYKFSILFTDTTGFIRNDSSHISSLNKLTEQIDYIESIKDISTIITKSINHDKVEIVNNAVEKYLDLSNPDREVLKFYKWDGDESEQSETALFANTVYRYMIEGIFKDELSLIEEDLYEIFIRNTTFVENSLKKIFQNPESLWHDDINTVNKREYLADIAIMAVSKALTDLKDNYGTIYWAWGSVNQPRFKHILHETKLIDLVNRFSVGPIQRSGYNINDFIFDENLTPVSTLALRRIYNLANINRVYSIVPTGQSGLPGSRHYSDQFELYTEQELRTTIINVDEIRNNKNYRKLILYPN